MTVQIRCVSPQAPLDVPLLRRVVERGAVEPVTDEQAVILLAQFENWVPVDAAGEKVAAAAVAEQFDRELAATGEPAPSALKPEWVAFAASKGDPDPASKRKADLVAEHGSGLPDPAVVAAALTAYGEEVAADQPAQLPSSLEPGGDEDDDPDGASGDDNGDAGDGDDSKGDPS